VSSKLRFGLGGLLKRGCGRSGAGARAVVQLSTTLSGSRPEKGDGVVAGDRVVAGERVAARSCALAERTECCGKLELVCVCAYIVVIVGGWV